MDTQTEEDYWSSIKKENREMDRIKDELKKARYAKELASLERTADLHERLEKIGKKVRSYKVMPTVSPNLYKLFQTIALNNSRFKKLETRELKSTFEKLSKKEISDRQFQRYSQKLKVECKDSLVFENSKGGRGNKLLISRKVVEKKKSIKGDIINNNILFTNHKAPRPFKDSSAACRWILHKISEDFTKNRKVFIDFALLKDMIFKFLKLGAPIGKILRKIIEFSWLKSFRKKLRISPEFHFWKIRDKMYKWMLSVGLCTKMDLSRKTEIQQKGDQQYMEMLKKSTDATINPEITEDEWNNCASVSEIVLSDAYPFNFKRDKYGLPQIENISDADLFASMNFA